MERFKGATWFSEVSKYKILIVGAGGIGSWTTLFLSRAGFNDIFIFDNDSIDRTNMSGQFFRCNQIGELKVDALKTNVSNYSTGTKLVNIPFMFDSSISTDFDIFISAVDNVEGRMAVYNKFKTSTKNNKLFIDGRLSAEFFQIHVLTESSNQEEHDNYRHSLDVLNTLEPDDCTYKQTTHIAAGIAFNITCLITNYITNKKLDENICNVKFVEFNAQLL